MNSDFGRLVIILSILLLLVFPFAGLAPLTLLVFVGVCGWGVRLFSTVIGATESTDSE
jgi:hypothetical protein